LRPPQHMLPSMEKMRRAVSGFLACQPVAFRTPKDRPAFTSLAEFPTALDPLQLTRKEMADYAVRAKQMGINYIGACCGTAASHIREMARALGKLPPMESRWREAYVGVRVLRTQPVRNSQEGVTILPEAHVAIRNLYGLPPPRTARVVIPFNEVTWHSHLSSTVRSTCLCDLPH